MKKFLGTVLIASFLGGCASTSTNTPIAPKPLHIATDTEYQWESDLSFAMNIARMAQPAGVGIGLEDVAKPKSFRIKRDRNGFLSAASGFAWGGGLGALSSLNLDSQSKRARTWRPTIINFYNEGLVENDKVLAVKTIREELANSIFSVIKKHHPSTELLGAFDYGTKKLRDFKTSNAIYFRGEYCESAYLHDDNISASDLDKMRKIQIQLSKNAQGFTFDGQGFLCVHTFDIQASAKFNDKYMVTAEMGLSGLTDYLVTLIGNHYQEGFLLKPDSYNYHSHRKPGARLTADYKYPSVVSESTIHLFDVNEQSKPTI